MTWKLVDRSVRPGIQLLVGRTGENGIPLTIEDPWGNVKRTVSGAKSAEYGVGGFEFHVVPTQEGYTLTIEGEEFTVVTIDGVTDITLERVGNGNGNGNDNGPDWIPEEVSGWPVTKRGLHGPPHGQHFCWAGDIDVWLERYQARGISWLLLPFDGRNGLDPVPAWNGTEREGKSLCEGLLDGGVIPIWRVNDLKMPQRYVQMEHVDAAVELYARYGLRPLWKLWNEYRLDNEWIGKKAPPRSEAITEHVKLFVPTARELANRGAIPVFGDLPNFDEYDHLNKNVYQPLEPVFDLWESYQMVSGLHNYGLNLPPSFPDVPAVTEGKPLERWRFNWMLGPKVNDPQWNEYGLQEINYHRAQMQDVPADISQHSACYRHWENHARWMEEVFGKVLLMGTCEGGWGPGDYEDPRWPRVGIEQAAWYNHEISTNGSPLLFNCIWLEAAALKGSTGGVFWEEKAVWGTEFTEWYGIEKPTGRILRV